MSLHLSRSFFFLIFLLFFQFSPFFNCYGSSNASLETVLSGARQKRLWKQRQWQTLLHYSSQGVFGGVESYIDSESFFLSPSGKTSPQLELLASLRSFYAQPEQGKENEHAQCLFPARFNWLQTRLDLTAAPQLSCTQQRKWLEQINVSGISLIFAESYLNNPASMFGHTFIRFNFRREDQSTDLLADTIGFAAQVDVGEKNILYGLKGLTGGFQGRFMLGPYSDQVQTYGYMENRDIWEYNLLFTGVELARMFDHLWELKNAKFDYYFLDENCSFHLLSLFEVARPSLLLTDNFFFWVLPVDTIKALAKHTGLIANVKYRPSPRTILETRATALSVAEIDSVKKLFDEREEMRSKSFMLDGVGKNAKVLDAAIDYAHYLYQKSSGQDQRVGKSGDLSMDALLARRSRLAEDSHIPAVKIPENRPDQSHGSKRFSMGVGLQEDDLYYQLAFRPVLHDLFDSSAGFIPGAAINILDTVIRLQPARSKVELESVSLVDITSLPAQSVFVKPYSWQVGLGFFREDYGDNGRALTGEMYAALGHNVSFADSALIYAFLKSTLYIQNNFEESLGVGIGPELGLFLKISENWKIGFQADAEKIFQSNQDYAYNLTHVQHVSLSDKYALRFEMNRERRFYKQVDTMNLNFLIYY